MQGHGYRDDVKAAFEDAKAVTAMTALMHNQALPLISRAQAAGKMKDHNNNNRNKGDLAPKSATCILGEHVLQYAQT